MSILDAINPYAFAMRVRRSAFRNGLFRSEHPGIPVISIGNLSIGGTGKTPLTIAIAHHLEAKGKRVAVVSRGYRRNSTGFVLVQEGSQILADVAKSGDEAQLMAEKLPHAIIIVDEDRSHGARQAKLLGADVILLDDGYQHLRLRRDLNILVVEGSKRLGNVLPFGRFREDHSAASAADVVISMNPESQSPNIQRDIRSSLRPETLIVTARTSAMSLVPIGMSQPKGLADLKGVRVMAVSSIASPERFYRSLREYGAVVIPHALRDHAAYDRHVMDRIARHAKSAKAEMIVTTEKDGVKSAVFFGRDWQGLQAYMLPITVEFIDGQAQFYQRIDTSANV
jgi:tetraacyldisaccharide 4'-kinase